MSDSFITTALISKRRTRFPYEKALLQVRHQANNSSMTQYYHVRDPMENLRISVALRKISGFGSDASGESVPVGRTWKYCFQWQEKKLSMSEKKREQERLEARGIHLSNRKRGGRNVPEIDSADILSTYVDVDDYLPKEHSKEQLATSRSSTTHLIPPNLSRRPRDKRSGSSWTSNHHRAWLRANREDKFRAMHIVALIEGAECVLCSMRFYKESGLFCVTPGFSAPIVEPESDPDLLIKGPKLTTYHVTTPSGSLYEYVIDNTNDLLPFASAEDQRLAREIRLQEEKRDATAVAHWQQQQNHKAIGTGLSDTGDTQRRLMLSLEVVGVDNPQTTDPIFVEYELALPHRFGHLEWKLQPGNSNIKRGKTPLSVPQQSYSGCGSSAAFGWHEHFNLKLFDREKSLVAAKTSSQITAGDDFGSFAPAPILYLKVYSLDWWRRKHTEGFGEIKLQESSGFYGFEVPIRKPISSIRDQMEELFLGIDDSNTDHDWNTERFLDREVYADESPISTMITSRLGQKSESTGSTVRIRCNIVDLRPATHANGAVKLMPAVSTTPLISTRVVKRSVQEILQSVKLEKRLASITDPRIQAALRSVPAGGVAAAESLIDQSALV